MYTDIEKHILYQKNKKQLIMCSRKTLDNNEQHIYISLPLKPGFSQTNV